MSDLASAEDLALLLGLTEAQAAVQETEDLLEMLVDGAVALFESDTNRVTVPFQYGETDRVETHRALGGSILLLDYPVKAVTTIVLGIDPLNPTEDLDPDDPEEVYLRVGSRTLIRTDGRGWHVGGWTRPCFVQVTYDTGDDLPEDARQAVLRLAAGMYSERTAYAGTGLAGELASETLDNYSATYTTTSTTMSDFAEAALRDPAWAIATARHRRLNHAG